MTKRFTGEFDKQYSGVHDNGEQLTNFEVVDLLNNLSEDNEYLEKRFKEEEWHYDHIDEDRDVWKYKCQELEKENEQLKEHLSTWRSSCCNYLNVYSILDNEVSILKETKDLDRFFEKFDKYSRMPFYEVEKSFIELQTENEQLKTQLSQLAKSNREGVEKVQSLAKENEKLKEEIKDLNDVLARYEEKELQRND